MAEMAHHHRHRRVSGLCGWEVGGRVFVEGEENLIRLSSLRCCIYLRGSEATIEPSAHPSNLRHSQPRSSARSPRAPDHTSKALTDISTPLLRIDSIPFPVPGFSTRAFHRISLCIFVSSTQMRWLTTSRSSVPSSKFLTRNLSSLRRNTTQHPWFQPG